MLYCSVILSLIILDDSIITVMTTMLCDKRLHFGIFRHVIAIVVVVIELSSDLNFFFFFFLESRLNWIGLDLECIVL